MKSFWLILAFIFLIQPIFPVLEYAVNFDYISNVLCVNTDKPLMKCNGKCQLGNKMAEQMDHNQTQDQKKANTSLDAKWNLFQQNNKFHGQTAFQLTKERSSFSSPTSHYQFNPILDLLRPPQFM
ncbi:MAG: hypothetical protein Q4G27_07360 [Flavobacteriaceae bacterium]|nr:hypothetical protein [Flavobacteriaceae bacterium]